jgi:MOSC domain-containing protein YiiM
MRLPRNSAWRLPLPEIVSVAARGGHGLGKSPCAQITLIQGEGVLGDAHCGVTVKHRSRVAKDPSQPNLRQVHLIHAELLDELATRGFSVGPGELGENVLTRGVDLLALSAGTKMLFPSGAVLQITGLRNPCAQINGHSPGLMSALLAWADDGFLIRKGGVMAIVLSAGHICAGDSVTFLSSDGPHQSLGPV